MKPQLSVTIPQKNALWPLFCLLVLTFSSCDRPPPELDRARMQLRRGDLESTRKSLEAMPALKGELAAEARAIRLELDSLEAGRAQFEQELEGLRRLDFAVAEDQLKRWIANHDDPWKQERMLQELSDLADRRAEESRRKPVPLAESVPESAPEPTPEELAQLAREEREERERQRQLIAEAVARAAAAPKEVPPEPEDAPSQDEPSAVATDVPLAALPQADELESAPAEPTARAIPIGPPGVPAKLLSALTYSEYELEQAHAVDRERAAETLRGIYPRDSYFLKRALRVRWDRTTAALLASPELTQLTRLHEKRMALEVCRSKAMDLIFDAGEYFYPYTYPDCSMEKAGTYGAVQRRVDLLVGELELAWADPAFQVLTEEFTLLLDELVWQRDYGADFGHFPSLPGGLRNWIFWVGAPGKRVTVQTFTSTPAELEALAYDRRVAAYNRGWWTQQGDRGLSAEARANPGEQAQVRVTNEYRRMFGLPTLAWNPMLQEAARGHAAYMRKVGEVTHTEEGDPARRSPIDRMALVGYNYGASENCADGFPLPEVVHRVWRRSSAHHRNLLHSDHTELGSALVGTFWAQNFGFGRDFQSELDKWHD